MCKRYIIIHYPEGELPVITGDTDDLSEAFNTAEGYVLTGATQHIFERISTGKPTPGVQWEGRRRPGAGV